MQCRIDQIATIWIFKKTTIKLESSSKRSPVKVYGSWSFELLRSLLYTVPSGLNIFFYLHYIRVNMWGESRAEDDGERTHTQ